MVGARVRLKRATVNRWDRAGIDRGSLNKVVDKIRNSIVSDGENGMAAVISFIEERIASFFVDHVDSQAHVSNCRALSIKREVDQQQPSALSTQWSCTYRKSLFILPTGFLATLHTPKHAACFPRSSSLNNLFPYF